MRNRNPIIRLPLSSTTLVFRDRHQESIYQKRCNKYFAAYDRYINLVVVLCVLSIVVKDVATVVQTHSRANTTMLGAR